MQSGKLRAVRKEERARQARNRRLSPRAKKTVIIVCAAVLTLAAGAFTVDLLRAKRCAEPLFCVPVIEYDNGSADYYGLFYKVWRDYDPFDDVTRYYVGFWLIPKSVSI